MMYLSSGSEAMMAIEFDVRDPIIDTLKHSVYIIVVMHLKNCKLFKVSTKHVKWYDYILQLAFVSTQLLTLESNSTVTFSALILT